MSRGATPARSPLRQNTGSCPGSLFSGCKSTPTSWLSGRPMSLALHLLWGEASQISYVPSQSWGEALRPSAKGPRRL